MGGINQNQIANEMYEAAVRDRNGSRTYLGMSQIGDPCSRKLWYGFRGYTPIEFDGRTLMIFELGNLIEDEVVRLLGSRYRIDSQQLSFDAHNGFFRGHCDGVIHGITQRPHILEIKSANKAKFKQFKDEGVRKSQPSYYCQVQCYMGYGHFERALFVIYCKDNSEIYTERVYFNPIDHQSLHNRALSIIESNNPPDRAFKQDSQECGWCNFRLHCWDDGIIAPENQVCGTCEWVGFDNLNPRCFFHSHPCQIERWGIGCPDWSE
jgi:hypothetical protein